MVYETREAYRKAWTDVLTIDPPIPLCVDLELSSLCNLRCAFCYRSDPAFNADHPPTTMTAKLALHVLDQAAGLGVPSVKLNWRGEPTLHPSFPGIAKHAERAGFHDILLNTNGNWLKPHYVLPGALCCTHVAVSLDSCRPKTYAAIRRGGNLLAVENSVRLLLAAGHPNLELRRVITPLNAHEDFAADCAETFGTAGYRVVEHYVFDRSAAHSTSSARLQRTYCGQPSRRLVVAADGTVLPCCVDYRMRYRVGNVTRDSLADCWARLMDLRSCLRKNDHMPEMCQKCESWSSYNDPRRKVLEEGYK